jgi:hypothetical protein
VLKGGNNVLPKMSELAERANNSIGRFSNKHFAPNEKIAGSFTQNPSLLKGATLVGESLPSLAAGVAATAATGNPVIGGMLMGVMDTDNYFEIRNQLEESGMTREEANKRAGQVMGTQAVSSGLLEAYGIGKILKGGVFKGAASESLTEGLQQLSQDIIAKFG